jgi:phenylalanyl-tRNA synthetase beta chain
MRPGIVPGLVATAARNIRLGTKSLRFFELGRVFRNQGGGKAKDLESDSLALVLSGPVTAAGWSQTDRAADLYDLKAVIAALLPSSKIQFVPKDRPGFALGAEVQADGQGIGVFARLLPSRERELDLGGAVFVAELDLAKLRKLRNGIAHAEPLPQFPGSSRDAAMDLPAVTANLEIEKAVAQVQQPLLVSFDCFDVFTDPTGEKLPADRKSVAYRFVYRAEVLPPDGEPPAPERHQKNLPVEVLGERTRVLLLAGGASHEPTAHVSAGS